MHELLLFVLGLIGLLDIIFIAVVVFFEKKDPNSTWVTKLLQQI